MPLDEATRKPIPKPHDYDHWLECRNCGTVYPKHETKVEPELRPVIQPGSNKGKLRGIQTKKRKQKGRGNNPRITQSDEIKDEDLKRELREGAQLISYSSSDLLS
jgi:hypothetical protein